MRTSLLKTCCLTILLYWNVYTANAQFNWNTPAQINTITRTLRFSYGGYSFTVELSFNRSDYNYYKALSKTQPYSNYATEHSSHPYLLHLAKLLDQDAKDLGYTGYTLAAYLVAFVQQAIHYTSDPYNYGYDYPRYPIETIIDKGGDCEDKSALLVALLNTFGFDALLVNTPGHMAAAISCQNCGGYYKYNGKKYSFIETTQSGWQIGAVPPSQYVNAKLLNVPRPLQYRRGEDEATVYTATEDKGNGFFNRGSWNGGNNNSVTCTTTLFINGTTYQVKGNGSTTLTVNGTTVIVSNNKIQRGWLLNNRN